MKREASIYKAHAVIAKWKLLLVQINLKGGVNHSPVLHHLDTMMKGLYFVSESSNKPAFHA